ncbi:hypothetical protein VaNZ11_014594 [Volvox africanus]|uniref:PhoD-like phosphatase domain-containing protein n=1 Tax=Volvox africanus TaxID=51714 RepID=A0ABQ5SKI1_9CHLO|nr:hypothetical protein VaNZ11_014594 [Volvox africanus]
MPENPLQRPLCESNESANPTDVVLDLCGPISGKGSVIPENTCCCTKLQAPHTVGPFLKFWGLERAPSAPGPANGAVAAEIVPEARAPRVWLGSLLVVTQAQVGDVAVELKEGSPGSVLEAEQLDSFDGWVALRFRLRIPLAEQDTKVHYAVTVSGQPLRLHQGDGGFCFHVAGTNSQCNAHWGFYSCSGFTPDVPPEHREDKWRGITPLWNDIRAVHNKAPLHLLVGGGDQLYCDDVWTLPSLAIFLKIPVKTEDDRTRKNVEPYDAGMRTQVDAYYFHHYCCHFSQPPIADVYALVPQVMSWDDHDIFDGWGSYAPYLQDSAVFKGVFASALRWYCVFQQHCKVEEKLPVAVYEVGRRTAIVACDMRHQRRPDEIVPLEHYMKISMLCTQLPKDIEHVVFVSTVPVVYPHVKGARTVLNLLKNGFLQCLLGTLGAKQLNQFGEPELLDDLDDHWSAPDHREERRFLIENLQMLSKYRGCRVTLLSGDVHVCGLGRLLSYPEPSDEMLLHDFRYMPQVISSAISNPPPPGGLIALLNFCSHGGRINRATHHKMTRELRKRTGLKVALENKRNWCEVQEEPFGNSGHALVFKLRVEELPVDAGTIKDYSVQVPPLQKLNGEYYDTRRGGLLARLKHNGVE